MPHDIPAPVLQESTPAASSPPGHAPRFWETILILLLYFALQFVLGGAFGYVSQKLAGAFPDQMPSNPMDRLVVVVILTIIGAAGTTLWAVRRQWGARLADAGPSGLGFTPPTGGQVITGCVLGIIAPLAGGMLTWLLAGGHDVTQAVGDIAQKASPAMRVAMLPVVVGLGPLVEEVLFRGALLSWVRTRFGDAWGIAGTSIVFGVVHLPDLGGMWYAVPNLILVGVFCAVLRVRTRSLWPAIVCHMANNALATIGWFTSL